MENNQQEKVNYRDKYYSVTMIGGTKVIGRCAHMDRQAHVNKMEHVRVVTGTGPTASKKFMMLKMKQVARVQRIMV